MLIDEKKYEGHTPAEHWDFSIWGIAMPTGFDADARLLADAPDLLAEVLRLRERNEKLNEQLTETRRWIRMQMLTLKTMVHQAEHVSCTAHDIEEWVGDD